MYHLLICVIFFRDNVKRLCATNGSTKFLPNNSITTVQTNKSTSSSRTPNTSRLKPPINIDNYTKKVLKLALPNSKNSDGSSSRKMIMKEKTEIKSQEKIINLPSKKIVLKGEGNEITSEERISKSTVKLSSEEKLTLSNGKHKRIVIDFSDSSTTTTKTPKLVNLKRSNSEVKINHSFRGTLHFIHILCSFYIKYFQCLFGPL